MARILRGERPVVHLVFAGIVSVHDVLEAREVLADEPAQCRQCGHELEGSRVTRTAGSAFGAVHGTVSLPRHWIGPFGDRLRSAISGFDGSRICRRHPAGAWS